MGGGGGGAVQAIKSRPYFRPEKVVYPDLDQSAEIDILLHSRSDVIRLIIRNRKDANKTLAVAPKHRGYSHIFNIRVWAALQGIVFKHFCQEQGIENMHFKSRTGYQIYASLE